MNLKRTVVCAVACATALCLQAKPGFGGHRPPPPHHHHHHGTGFAVGAGLLGAGLLASTIYDATHPRSVVVTTPAVVTPAPVVVQQPVVVQPAPVVVQPAGHYETRVQNVWVEGRYVDQVSAGGAVVRTWQPGHYEQQSTQVFVSP